MLSDSLRELRERIRACGMPQDTAGVMLTLRAYEMEARNMEERIEMISGRPHAPLDGHLMASPVIDLAQTRMGAAV
jgi:hypothetical protein